MSPWFTTALDMFTALSSLAHLAARGAASRAASSLAS
jgi:hypothetical protein